LTGEVDISVPLEERMCILKALSLNNRFQCLFRYWAER